MIDNKVLKQADVAAVFAGRPLTLDEVYYAVVHLIPHHRAIRIYKQRTHRRNRRVEICDDENALDTAIYVGGRGIVNSILFSMCRQKYLTARQYRGIKKYELRKAPKLRNTSGVSQASVMAVLTDQWQTTEQIATALLPSVNTARVKYLARSNVSKRPTKTWALRATMSVCSAVLSGLRRGGLISRRSKSGTNEFRRLCHHYISPTVTTPTPPPSTTP